MAPPDDPPLLRIHDAPAAVVRGSCERFLVEAEVAAARLADPADAEALHDLRVALRRLRSQLRAYRPFLPRSTKKGLRQRLRELAAATGDARDVEVQLAWLEAERDAIDPADRGAFEFLVGRLSRRGERVALGARLAAASALPPIARRLVRRLARDQASPSTTARFADAAAERLASAARELFDHAARVASAHDERQAHQARIAAKRLRYLVEPLRDADHEQVAASARALVKHLKEVQDVLGELHDAHVMSRVVERALVAAAGAQARHRHRALAEPEVEAARPPPGDLRDGLLAIDRSVCARRDALFSDFERARAAGRFDGLRADAEALARLLSPG
jgi:CHAD domain-containing protein